MKQPEKQDVWRGSHLDFSYKIVHWGQETSINEGKGQWNYYIYIQEPRVPDFESLWLEPKVVKILPTSKGFISYDYYSIPPSRIDWHGGVTFYAKHGEVPGYRVIELGCDYSHLWDMEAGYTTTFEDVLYDCEQTITQLNELYPEVP